MARFRTLVLLLAVLLVVAACGSGGGAAQPTSAPSGGTDAQPTVAAEAPTAAAEQPTAAAAPTAAEQPTASAEQPTAASAGEQPTAAAAGGEVPELQVDKSKLSAELHFYNWTDYIDEQILADFEQEYGVKVVIDTYDSNEVMLAKVRPGNSGYDVVVPSDYAVQIMINEKLIDPLDKSLIPNIAHMKPQNLDLYYDNGNQYSVPYFFGITGIAYNKSKFPTPPDSWAVLFDPQQAQAYQGEFSMLDDERESPGAALRFLGKSVNDTDAADLKQAQDLLTTQKPLLAAYNSSDVNRRLASGEYVIAHAWNGQALQARLGLGDEFAGNPDIEFVIPKEGGVIWQDNLAILADSPNKYTAHVFINYLHRPDVAAKNEEYVQYLTPNKDAEPLLSTELQEVFKEGFAPDDETYKRLEWIERNSEQGTAFSDLWTAVKGE
jgi:spermidine/putrescine transport system substrate-binding protein